MRSLFVFRRSRPRSTARHRAAATSDRLAFGEVRAGQRNAARWLAYVPISQRGHLLGENPMQSRRLRVPGYADRHERADRGFELTGVLREHLTQRVPLLRTVPSTQFGDDRFLPREVLVERCDVDAGPFGDPVRREFCVPLPNQNVSRRLEHCLDGGPRSVLSRLFSGRKLSFAHRLSLRAGMQADNNISKCLHYIP